MVEADVFGAQVGWEDDLVGGGDSHGGGCFPVRAGFGEVKGGMRGEGGGRWRGIG
jgi:hypothetical protein